MNILHLLSQNHLTGAEVYAVTLGQEQINQGHVVHQISNGFFYPSPLKQQGLEVETKSNLTFFKNIFWLRSFIDENKIDVVHAHSRAGSKLAYWATLGQKVAYISTVHGQQHSSASKRFFNQYGQFMIAVCENIQNHLISDFKYRPELMRVIRNPIQEAQFYFSLRPEGRKSALKIGIIGRTTGPKKERTEQVLRALFEISRSQQVTLEITLVGGKKNRLSVNRVRPPADC